MRFHRMYLIVVFFLYTLLVIYFVLSRPIWSPLDEIGHYDYVDQLSSGHIPSPAEPISDYTFGITKQHFDWIRPGSFEGTKGTMGAAGYSYEAQQPPVYYLLLALPNLVLKLFHVDPRTQVVTLRFLNALFEILGAAAGGLVVYRLEKLLKFSPLWKWFIPVVLLIPNWAWRSSLGNGNLSLLLVNLAFFFALGSFIDTSSRKNGALAVLFGSLAVLTKYTNILALAGVLVLLAIQELRLVRSSNTAFSVKRIFAISWPLLLILVYVMINMSRFGLNDPLGSRAVENIFTENAIQVWGVRFFEMLFRTSYTISFLQFSIPVAVVIFIGAAATAVRTLVSLFKKETAPGLAWTFICGMVFALAAFAWVMTKISPTVDWGFFRHFSGYLLFIALISFGAFMRSGIVEKYSLYVFSLAALVPALFYISRIAM